MLLASFVYKGLSNGKKVSFETFASIWNYRHSVKGSLILFICGSLLTGKKNKQKNSPELKGEVVRVGAYLFFARKSVPQARRNEQKA